MASNDPTDPPTNPIVASPPQVILVEHEAPPTIDHLEAAFDFLERWNYSFHQTAANPTTAPPELPFMLPVFDGEEAEEFGHHLISRLMHYPDENCPNRRWRDLLPLPEVHPEIHIPLPEHAYLDPHAWYKPIHFHGRAWGITIREHGIETLFISMMRRLLLQTDRPELADAIANDDSSSILAMTSSWMYMLCLQIIRHHQKFHHFVEMSAFQMEAALLRQLYWPYFDNIYTPAIGTDRMLEESLAEAYAYRAIVENECSTVYHMMDLADTAWKADHPDLADQLGFDLLEWLIIDTVLKAMCDNAPGYRQGRAYIDEYWQTGLCRLCTTIRETEGPLIFDGCNPDDVDEDDLCGLDSTTDTEQWSGPLQWGLNSPFDTNSAIQILCDGHFTYEWLIETFPKIMRKDLSEFLLKIGFTSDNGPITETFIHPALAKTQRVILPRTNRDAPLDQSIIRATCTVLDMPSSFLLSAMRYPEGMEKPFGPYDPT